MITLNGKKFAANKEEFASSLFESGGTCRGYYKAQVASIALFDPQMVKIGIINKCGVLARYDAETKFYSYGMPEGIGEYKSFMQQVEEPEEIFKSLLPDKFTVNW